MSSRVKLDVGPVAPGSVVAWIHWADEAIGNLRMVVPSTAALSTDALDGLERYFEQWRPRAHTSEVAFRWHAEVDPDELEFLLCALFSLDTGSEAQRRAPLPICAEGRPFYLVLVRALLHGLETHSRGRAAFADQLRAAWPSAAEAN